MSKKSKLRKEYEAVFGVVEGALRLYDAKGNETYREDADGCCCKYQYDAEDNMICSEHSVDGCKYQYEASGKMIYYEDSIYGVTLDKRSGAGKVFIEEQTGKKFKMTEIK
jgi:YD repeat-containing protein